MIPRGLEGDVGSVEDPVEFAVGEAQARFAAIVNGSDDAIWSMSLGGRILSWNPAAARLFGYEAAEILGQPVLRLVPPELQEQEEQLLQALRCGQGVDHFDTVRCAKNGDRLDVSVTIAPIRNAQGVLTGTSTITRDIRERKRERALLEAHRRKDDFMRLLGHELRNPVVPICNAAELLSRILHGQSPAQGLSEIIRRQARQLSRLIDDLLDVARISQGRIALDEQTLLLADVIAQGIEVAMPLIEAKEHDLVVVASSELHVRADATRLAQCFGNLLINAAKYTDRGGHIQVESRAEGDFALVEVTDNGCGISAELMPRIFDLYVQGERNVDVAEGLGIGLSVVKRLIELQGGTVIARSDGPGHGATFQIRLPLAPAPAAVEEATAPRANVMAAASEPGAARITRSSTARRDDPRGAAPAV